MRAFSHDTRSRLPLFPVHLPVRSPSVMQASAPRKWLKRHTISEEGESQDDIILRIYDAAVLDVFTTARCHPRRLE